jgi:RHS repeat-associated protein
MTGYVSDYYNGTDGRSNDEGFPYSRKRLEYSTLGRVLESGQPGAAHAIRTGNIHTTRFLYGTNAANPFFATAPVEQYEVHVAIDPDGLTSTTVSDQLNNKVAAVQGSVNNSERQQHSVQLDAWDNPKTVRPPNFYAPPTGSPSDWQQTAQYDIFGRLTESTSNDAHTTRKIYDTLGNLRFELIADGTPAAGDANPCGAQTAIRYRTYDVLNRVTESGWVCIAQWDKADLQAKANQNWPPQNTQTWRFRYHYDGDGTQKNAQGRLTSVETRQANGDIVTEAFAYDLAGKVLSRQTSVPKAFSQAVCYQRNHAGKVTKKIIPSLTGGSDLTLNYTYDPRGLVATVGSGQGAIAKYIWDAAGKPVSEVLGDGVVHRNFTYTASGHPATIAGNRSSETFHYYHDGAGTPRYDGLPSALTFRFADAPEVTWTIDWDNFQRITGVTVTGGAGSNQRYHYDANGNVTAHNDTTFVYKSGTNQVKSGSGVPGEFTYTPAGKTAASPGLQFRYNFDSGLVTDVNRTDASGTLSVTFGSSAQRLVKSWTGASKLTRQYLPGTGGRSLVERTEVSGSSPTELRYVFGPLGLVAMQSNETGMLYVVRDHEQSVRQVITSGGETAAAFNYLPFGRLSSEDGTNPGRFIYRYTGQEWDAETGLYNYRHRLYDPHTRRFLSPDPAQQYFSPYLYVGDDPLLLTDPTGEFSAAAFGASLGAFFLGVLGVAGAVFTGGASLVGVLLGTAGTAGMGFGIAGMGYTLRASHETGTFNWSQWAQAGAGGAIGALEVAAGVVVAVITDATGVGGTVGNIGAATLLGMGFSGLFYSTFAGKDYNWIDWGINQGVGAAGGLITGGFGAGGSLIAESTIAQAVFTQIATEFPRIGTQFLTGVVKASFGAVGGYTSSLVGDAVNMAAHHEELFSWKNITGDLVSAGLGILGPALGRGFSQLAGERVNFYRSIVKNGLTFRESWSETGWGAFEKGARIAVPRLINPLMFNSKKAWWPVVPNF